MDYLRIACIARPHGVQGAVKAIPLTDDVTRFRGLTEGYLEIKGQHKPVSVAVLSIQPDAVFMQLEGVATREAAELLRNVYLCVDREHAVKLPPYTYFVADLIGCEASDTQGNALGKITDVLQTGANDVYVVQGKGRVMIPALKKVLHEVDVANKKIVFEHAVLEEVALFED